MADISYTPTTWADGAEGGTPINSTRLNNIESGIVDAVAAIGPNDTTEDGTLKAQIDGLNTAVNACVRSTGITTDAFLYTYEGGGGVTLMQLGTSYGQNNGMFLQIGTGGSIDIYKVVGGVQQLVRSI